MLSEAALQAEVQIMWLDLWSLQGCSPQAGQRQLQPQFPPTPVSEGTK